jgi:DNA-binding response OmpR family regulator
MLSITLLLRKDRKKIRRAFMTKYILIADDNRVFRKQLEQLLARQNYEVLIAQNSEQLVQIAQEYVPDLVLVDLMTEYLGGYEAIRVLRYNSRTAYLPIIILSTKAAPNDIVAGLDAGADDYIAKPFNIPELLARIDRRLCHAAQQQAGNSYAVYGEIEREVSGS